MKIETPNSLRIQKARTALLLDHPFFGSLLYRLKDRESRAVKTMATDGISLLWNPEFVETLTAATLAGTLQVTLVISMDVMTKKSVTPEVTPLPLRTSTE